MCFWDEAEGAGVWLHGHSLLGLAGDWLPTLYQVFPARHVGLIVRKDDYWCRNEGELGGHESQYGSPRGCFYAYTMHSIGRGVPAEKVLVERD